MKITVLQSHRSLRRYRQQGLTLIEISLVIALLLGLITVLFLGIGAYREGADKAKCKMQLAQVQKAVRSHANMNNLNAGQALTETAVFGEGKLLETKPVCPSTGLATTYTSTAIVPGPGELYMNCGFKVTGGVTHILVAADYADW